MRARRNNRGCACKAMGLGCVSVCGCRVGVCRNRFLYPRTPQCLIDLDFILVIDCPWF